MLMLALGSHWRPGLALRPRAARRPSDNAKCAVHSGPYVRSPEVSRIARGRSRRRGRDWPLHRRLRPQRPRLFVWQGGASRVSHASHRAIVRPSSSPLLPSLTCPTAPSPPRTVRCSGSFSWRTSSHLSSSARPRRSSPACGHLGCSCAIEPAQLSLKLAAIAPTTRRVVTCWSSCLYYTFVVPAFVIKIARRTRTVPTNGQVIKIHTA